MSSNDVGGKSYQNEPDKPWDWKIDVEKKQLDLDWVKDLQESMKKMRPYKSTIPKDPINVLRNEMREELKGIKNAIRKLGIMFDEDAPTEKMMEKHKMLRDAYNKYKMIETLILGQQD